MGEIDRIMAQYARRHGKVFPTLTGFYYNCFLYCVAGTNKKEKKKMGEIINHESPYMDGDKLAS